MPRYILLPLSPLVKAPHLLRLPRPGWLRGGGVQLVSREYLEGMGGGGPLPGGGRGNAPWGRMKAWLGGEGGMPPWGRMKAWLGEDEDGLKRRS
ncbi:MAG: hypothetical protein KJ624_04860 [Chloroflexi bacterium]|nr:hypothetical protein [Chloroflexota bacterium]